MSYPKNIVKLRPANGLNADLPASEVGPEFYTTTNNVHFRDGYAQRTAGEAEVYEPLLTNLRNVINVIAPDGTNYWIYSGENKVYARTGAVDTDISYAGISTVSSPDDFTTDTLGGLLTWNNGTDAPKYWDLDTATDLVSLPNWVAGDQCGALRAYKYHLFALGMTESVAGQLPQKLKWSDSALPGAAPSTWVPAATNDAGSTQLSDTPGGIIDAAPLRSSFIIYKQHSTYLCDWVGGNFVFSFRKLFATSGVLARNCIAEYNGRHYVFTTDDIIVHDGNQLKSLVDQRTKRVIFDGLDQDNFRNSFVINYEKHREIWFCYPTAGNTYANIAAIYNIEHDAWSFRDLVTATHGATGLVADATPDNSWTARTELWSASTDPWNQQLFSTAEKSLVYASNDAVTAADSKLIEVDSGADFDGSAITATLQKNELDFGEPDRLKLVKRIWPKLIGTAGTEVSIRAGGCAQPDCSITWGPAVTFTIGTDSKADLFAQGRYISVEISSADGLPWTLTGFDIEAELRGYF